MEKVLSVHKIIGINDFTFNTNEYSKFKYGCVDSCVSIAEQMVKKFLSHDKLYNILDEDIEILIVPYGYRHIPSAATFLADNIRLILNWHFHNKGQRPVIMTKMHRHVVCEPDYGTLSLEDRQKILDNEKLSVNEDVVKNKFVLFVDDVRITGSHEKVVDRMINTYSHKDHMCLYYAEAVGDVPPNIENTLNKSCVKDVEDLVYILSNKHYMGARMVKEVLRLKESDIHLFVNSFTEPNVFINIVNHAIAEGYDKLGTFKNNFNYLKTIVTHEFNKPAEATSNQS